MQFLKILGMSIILMLAIVGMITMVDQYGYRSEKDVAHQKDMVRTCNRSLAKGTGATSYSWQLVCRKYGVELSLAKGLK